MGAYLSEPNLNKDSLDDGNEKIAYGASSMQGWRLEQEDAHNSILDFDSKTSFFAVYDGHGGHEVAAYCAKYLPEFLKTIEEYSKDDIEAALKKLFLKFDESLLSEKALEELMRMRDTVSGQSSVHDNEEALETAAVSDKAESDKEDNVVEQKSPSKHISKAASEVADTIVSETAALYDEATMPLEEVLKRYASTEKKMNKALTKNHLKNAKSAHLSPMIKTKQVRLTAAELDQQEEIDITEIKKNGKVELNGSETNCELDYDEASNLGDVTDSQKEADTTSKSISSIDSQPIKSEESSTKTATTESTTVTANNGSADLKPESETAMHTPNSKHRLKLRQEEIKLSPIRNKSLSCSSLCDEAASSQRDDTMVSSVDGNEPSATELDLATTAKNDENKENDNGDQVKAKEVVEATATTGDGEDMASAVVTTRSKRQSKADKNNLLAKLIAGVINKRLKRGQTSQENDKNEEGLYDEEDQDDDFDADYSEGDDEGSEEEATGSEGSTDGSDDGEGDESDDEDYENDESDEDEEDADGNDYPISNGVSKPGFDSGCTAVVAVLRDNKKLYVANAGDSRCIVCRDGKAVDMSYDHKPEDDLERERVEKAGGQVTSDGRINNGLNLSRAIGDHTYKRNKDLPLAEQMITSLPDVMTLDIDATKDKFMVLACDGIWNFMSSQEVCDYITERLEANYAKLSQICEELFLHCLAPNTEGDGTGCDNMTCILVTFQPFQKVELKLNKSALMNMEKNDLKRTGSASIEDSNLTVKKLKTEEEQTAQVTA